MPTVIEEQPICVQGNQVPRCSCGNPTTRLVGQCEECWKQQPMWPRKLSPRAIAAADRKKRAAKK